MKNVYLIHGWDGHPDGGFRPYLKRELEARRYTVTALAMPDPNRPNMETWIPYMRSSIASPDESTIIVGHSMGSLATLKYLEMLPEGTRIWKAVLIAGPIDTITNVGGDEEAKIAEPWLRSPINYEKVKRSAKEIVAFFDDADEFIPIETEKLVREKLGAKTIIEHARDHWSDSNDATRETPTILEEIIAE